MFSSQSSSSLSPRSLFAITTTMVFLPISVVAPIPAWTIFQKRRWHGQFHKCREYKHRRRRRAHKSMERGLRALPGIGPRCGTSSHSTFLSPISQRFHIAQHALHHHRRDPTLACSHQMDQCLSHLPPTKLNRESPLHQKWLSGFRCKTNHTQWFLLCFCPRRTRVIPCCSAVHHGF